MFLEAFTRDALQSLMASEPLPFDETQQKSRKFGAAPGLPIAALVAGRAAGLQPERLLGFDSSSRGVRFLGFGG